MVRHGFVASHYLLLYHLMTEQQAGSKGTELPWRHGEHKSLLAQTFDMTADYLQELRHILLR